MFKENTVTNYVCAKCRGGCCQRFNESVIAVTFNEIKRIQNTTGLPARHIAGYGKTDPSWWKDIKDDKETKEFYNGEKTVLLRSEGNKCIFLTAKGCSLPHNAKPITCRFFPLWYEKKKGRNQLYLADEDMEDCLLWEKYRDTKNLDKLIKEMGETRAGLQRQIKRFEKEKKLFKKYKPFLENNSIQKIMDWMQYNREL
jgi:Fe-S-cluster containining protein